MSRSYNEVIVGGVKIACLSRKDLANLMVEECHTARSRAGHIPRLVFSANGNSIARSAVDAEFRSHYDSADIIHADGQPIVLLADRGRTGGYAKPAVVDVRDLGRLAQAPAGTEVAFAAAGPARAQSLNLGAGGFGLSIGNSIRWDGLRINLRDDGVDHAAVEGS